MAKLGSLNNIYTGWYFSGDKLPTSIFSLGWFDLTNINQSHVYDVYFMGWNKTNQPKLIMNGGWFDSTTETLSDYNSRLYTLGWFPRNNISVESNGWFDTFEINPTIDKVYNVYFMGWNKPNQPKLIMNGGWFDGIEVQNIVSILDKLNLSINLKDLRFGLGNDVITILDNLILTLNNNELTPKILSEFISFINSEDIRDVRMEVDLAKYNIIFRDNTNIVSRNIGSW